MRTRTWHRTQRIRTGNLILGTKVIYSDPNGSGLKWIFQGDRMYRPPQEIVDALVKKGLLEEVPPGEELPVGGVGRDALFDHEGTTLEPEPPESEVPDRPIAERRPVNW